jgi:hypothetical protein
VVGAQHEVVDLSPLQLLLALQQQQQQVQVVWVEV